MLGLETVRETSKKHKLLIHLVPRDAEGNPADKALCGFLWDRLDVQGTDICEECLEEAERRG